MTDGTPESGTASASGSLESTTGRGGIRRAGEQVVAVATREYRLAVRNRWGPALAGLFAAFALALTAFGGTRVGPVRASAVIVSLASLATYLVPLAALAFGYDAVVGADEAGWLDVVFALPASRRTIVAGIYLGRAITLAAATVIGFGSAGVVLAAIAGGLDWGLYLRFLLGAVGMGAAFLSVGVLVSTVATEKARALGAALAAWVWFVFVHDLLALGIVAAVPLPGAVLSAFVLLNPADAFRVLVLSGVDAMRGGLAAALVTTGLGTPALVAGLAAWCVGPLLAAGRLVKRRTV